MLKLYNKNTKYQIIKKIDKCRELIEKEQTEKIEGKLLRK